MHLTGIRFMTRKRDYRVPDATGGGNSLEENPNISSMPRWTSNSVSFHVWTFHKVCPANPQTMSGLSGAPSGTASQTILNRVNRNSLPSAIENKADGSSDIGFARLCFVHWCQQGAHTKVLKLSADYEHTLWNVRNLEKHRSSRMFDAAWLEIPDFTIRIAVPDCIWNAIVSFSYRKTYPI